MPSISHVHSFPGPLGRRGTVALAVAAFHVLLVAGLIAGLGIRLPTSITEPLIVVPVPPSTTPVEPVRMPQGATDDELVRRVTLDPPDVPRDVVPSGDGITVVDPTTPTGGTSRPVDDGSTMTFAPRVLKSEQPPYPAAARRLGEEGSVVLRVRVDALGRAEIVEIATSSGSARLDEAAVRSVQRWRFDPARAGTQAIAGWVSLKVTFRLTT
jgi:protein TonB